MSEPLFPDERATRTVTIDHIAGIFTMQVDLHPQGGAEDVGDIRLYADAECEQILADDIRFVELSESQRLAIFDALNRTEMPVVPRIMVRPVRVPVLTEALPW